MSKEEHQAAPPLRRNTPPPEGQTRVDVLGLEDEAETSLVSALERRSSSSSRPARPPSNDDTGGRGKSFRSSSSSSLRSSGDRMSALGDVLLLDLDSDRDRAAASRPPQEAPEGGGGASAPERTPLPPPSRGGGRGGSLRSSWPPPAPPRGGDDESPPPVVPPHHHRGRKGHRRYRTSPLSDVAFRVRAMNRARVGLSADNVVLGAGISPLETGAGGDGDHFGGGSTVRSGTWDDHRRRPPNDIFDTAADRRAGPIPTGPGAIGRSGLHRSAPPAPSSSPFEDIWAAPPITRLHDQAPSDTEHMFDHVQYVEALFHIAEAGEESSPRRERVDPTMRGEGSGRFPDANGRRRWRETGGGSARSGGENDDEETACSDTPLLKRRDGNIGGSPPLWKAASFVKSVLLLPLGRWREAPGHGSTNEERARPDDDPPLSNPEKTPRRSIHSDLKDVLNVRVLLGIEMEFLRTTVLPIILPCLIAAFVLYYPLGNPELDFLPSDASLSWWFLFAARQLLTLHLAMDTEYVLVEAVALHSVFYLKMFGPLAAMLVIQSKGWPFVVACWGLWDLVLTRESGGFQGNWLWFSGLGIFSDRNPGEDVLQSELYFNILISLVIAGVATAMKRTYVTLYLGKRTFVHYKPQLERLLVDMKILAEVADLAAEVEAPEFEKVLSLAEDFCHSPSATKKSTAVGLDIQFQDDGSAFTGDDSSPSESEYSIGTTEQDSFTAENPTKKGVESSKPDVDEPLEKAVEAKLHQLDPTDALDSFVAQDVDSQGNTPGPSPDDRRPKFKRQRAETKLKSKFLLDRWEEPINKSEKGSDPSIHDILQFRKALSYMDDSHPFSLSFGPANTRDKCFKSAQRLYKKLLKYTPEATILAFDVISALAYEEDGSINKDKSKSLVRFFHPDENNELPPLAFIQLCDGVYKRLRYFRASVGNSAMIDNVLEQIVNLVFYFTLTLIILGLLKFNPWTLLVSLSTLTVSFAFALGPSVAKCVEGIFLIAVRRPYDLGDRISICPADATPNPEHFREWFVEDITLYQTTLRHCSTNEVSTVSNGSIATSRIFNGMRSPRATIVLQLSFKLDTTHEQIRKFRAEVEQYIRDRPRTWLSLLHFRGAERMDLDMGLVEYSLKLQHHKSWQEAPFILASRADLTSFCYDVGKSLDINYEPLATAVDVHGVESRKILAHFSHTGSS